MKAPVSLLREYAAGGSVREAGVGTGRIAVPLAQTGADVYGIQISEKMAEQLRAKAAGHLVRLEVGDMASFRFDALFSVVYVAQGGLHRLLGRPAPRRYAVLHERHRA